MKRLALLFSLFLLYSCGGKSSDNAESGNILENLTFTVDTVLINPSEELIDLSGGIRVSDFSKDKKLLYLLGLKSKMLYIFDLEQK